MAGQESFETINKCRTRLMRGGKGAPMIFLHGARGASAWLPFMDRLAETFELIVPEHPGFGGSDTPPWLDNIGDLAYFYLDLIDRLGLDGVHLVGTSLGGWIAAEIAVRDCHPLRTLTLSAPAGIHVKGVAKGDVFMWSAEETMKRLFHDPAWAEKALAHKAPEGEVMIQAKNRLTLAKLGWQPRLYNPDLYKWLHRIAVPTLILWGDDDQVIPPPYGPAFAGLIPGARLEVIEKCGHLPQIERADAFVAKITAFITEAAR
jgi:pimeloyl-ACP methyl ester carboxylesterase